MSVIEEVALMTKKVAMFTAKPSVAEAAKRAGWERGTETAFSECTARGSSCTAAAAKSHRAEIGAIKYWPSITCVQLVSWRAGRRAGRERRARGRRAFRDAAVVTDVVTDVVADVVADVVTDVGNVGAVSVPRGSLGRAAH